MAAHTHRLRNDAERTTLVVRVRRALMTRLWEMLCAAILLATAANLLCVAARKGLTVDESVIAPAGYYHLTARDFRPVSEHPPLVKLMSGAALYAAGASAPP
ncbi:MAG TPA: hypothetical protein VGW12_18965, partial [Pyrinomonadaceae bacterium]|nr:hypothetical protein [Pyrinomonadaceae bacterium]